MIAQRTKFRQRCVLTRDERSWPAGGRLQDAQLPEAMLGNQMEVGIHDRTWVRQRRSWCLDLASSDAIWLHSRWLPGSAKSQAAPFRGRRVSPSCHGESKHVAYPVVLPWYASHAFGLCGRVSICQNVQHWTCQQDATPAQANEGEMGPEACSKGCLRCVALAQVRRRRAVSEAGVRTFSSRCRRVSRILPQRPLRHHYPPLHPNCPSLRTDLQRLGTLVARTLRSTPCSP